MCISQIPYRSAIHPPSFYLPLFIGPPPPISSFFSFFSLLPPFPPSIAHFSTIFPARSTSIVIVVVPRFHSGEFSRNLEVYPTSRIVLETKNEEPCYDGDWLIRYTVIRFFCGRFKILLFSYSIRFHVANRTNIPPPPPQSFEWNFIGYNYSVSVSPVTSFLLFLVVLLSDYWSRWTDTRYSNSTNNYANIIRIIYKIDADVKYISSPFQRNSIN